MSGRPVETFPDWMRQMERRSHEEERRPSVTKAADLMGPGLAPNAVLIPDWSHDATTFNGFFYSVPGALNTPDPLLHWMGESLATPDGYGYQRVVNYRLGAQPPMVMVRTFTSPGGTRVFSAWQTERSVQQADATGGPLSIPDSSKVDIPGLSLVISVPSTASVFLVTLDIAAQKIGATDATLATELAIAGTAQPMTVVMSSTEASSRHNGSRTLRVTGVAPGSWTFKARSWIDSGSGTWNILSGSTQFLIERI